MQYNNRAILAMIASAINPEKSHYEKCEVSHTVMSDDAIVVYMVDGRQFQVTVKEAV